jgi:hypothetical protein
VANTVLSGFGLSSNVIAAMRRNAFREDVFQKAPTYSDAQIKALNKADAAWRGLGLKIKMAMGEFSADEGLKLIQSISKITSEVLKMTRAFVNLADELKIFDRIGQSFEGWGLIFKGLTGSLEDIKNDGLGSWLKDTLGGIKDAAKGAVISLTEPDASIQQKLIPSPVGSQSVSTTNQNTVNQTLNFNSDTSDPAQIGNVVKKAASEAYRQMSTQGQEN